MKNKRIPFPLIKFYIFIKNLITIIVFRSGAGRRNQSAKNNGMTGGGGGLGNRSEFQVLNRLRQVGQLHFLDLLGNVDVEVHNGGNGACRCRTEARLLLLQLALLLNSRQNLRHVRLQHHTSHHQLVQNVMHLVGVKDQVQLAHILKALVQCLNKDLYEIQDAQLRFRRINAKHKIQGRIVSINQLVVGAANERPALQEIAHIVVPL